jgi:hypothetical protein
LLLFVSHSFGKSSGGAVGLGGASVLALGAGDFWFEFGLKIVSGVGEVFFVCFVVEHFAPFVLVYFDLHDLGGNGGFEVA